MNKKFGDDVPKVDATLLFDELSFIIDNEQYRDAVLMVDLFHSYLKRQKVMEDSNNNQGHTLTHFLLVPSSSSRGRRYTQVCTFGVFQVCRQGCFIRDSRQELSLDMGSFSETTWWPPFIHRLLHCWTIGPCHARAKRATGWIGASPVLWRYTFLSQHCQTKIEAWKSFTWYVLMWGFFIISKLTSLL